MTALLKVTFDSRSGRPIAPVWWRLVSFFVVYAWLMAALMLLFAYLGMRDGRLGASAAAFAAGILILAFVYREKRRIKRLRKAFNESVKAYERALSGKL